MRLRVLPVAIGALFILGAGCTTAQPPVTDTSKDTTQSEVKGTTDTTTGDTTNTSTDITLTGTSTGPNSVKLEWSPSETIANSVQKWWIIGGSKENPSYPGTKFVFERSKNFRDKEWKGLAAGTTHFRVCAVVDQKCTVYSNDLVMEIPGYTPGTK